MKKLTDPDNNGGCNVMDNHFLLIKILSKWLAYMFTLSWFRAKIC